MSKCFIQAAARHLHDAMLLLSKQRWDNAVYLAGYVVECSFKVLVEVYIPDKTATKKFGHDLTKLQGQAIDRLRLMYPVLEFQLPASRITGTALDQDHPERRYSQTGRWNDNDAQQAVQQAADIYIEIVPKLILDGIITIDGRILK